MLILQRNKNMLKSRLKEIDLKITEIAEYLQLSRPTVYKFIDCYDKKQFKMIDGNALKLFNFIEENSLVGKRGVISFILKNFTDVSTSDDVFDEVNKYLRENPESKKSSFICTCIQSNLFDDIIYYLEDVKSLINKKDLTPAERELTAPYEELINKINVKKPRRK